MSRRTLEVGAPQWESATEYPQEVFEEAGRQPIGQGWRGNMVDGETKIDSASIHWHKSMWSVGVSNQKVESPL